TQQRFKGGRLYAWNPYDATAPAAYFSEASRADPVSTFVVRLAPWMTGGFHFKLVGAGQNGNDWEPDGSIRVWRPSDGSTMWVKSGQVSVRSKPLTLVSVPVEAVVPVSLEGPAVIDLVDPIENYHQSLSPTLQPFAGSPLFLLATYSASIYPDAAYEMSFLGAVEGDPALARPFPADPDHVGNPSRLILGSAGWVSAFPTVAASVTLIAQPKSTSTFAAGVTVLTGVGEAIAHDSVQAARTPDGNWQATVTVVQTLRNWVRLIPVGGNEPKPYDWIDTRRFFTPPAAAAKYHTAEGVYGMATSGPVSFAEPPSRTALMQAAFGAPLAGTGVFGAHEMPHGATLAGADVYFIVHAPHAAWAALILVDENAPGGPTRRQIEMTLTPDTLYWWCAVPSTQALPGARYRFALNDDLEVMDPAAREVQDRGNFETSRGDDPRDSGTSWSLVPDVAAWKAQAHAHAWQTMGWEALLVYELHPKRFTDLGMGGLASLDLLTDELQLVNRTGVAGYLRTLPVTVLELLPVHEFKSLASWGYNPAFFFAIDSGYGGSGALARFVNTAHAAGRGVFLDMVYNHMNDSPLTQIATDVYRNGDAWGDKINNAHPMVKEFFRQATVYLWQTFGVDGFRFDSTTTIVQNNGWDFLASIRNAIRAAASSEGRNWPYFVGENDPKYWDITNPAWGVMDGQWDITELYDLGAAAYDPWDAKNDHAGNVKPDMDVPQTWIRQFYEATRFGESHDSVSGQDPGNKRIAARPPFGLGLRMGKAIGALVLLSNGVPLLFMGEEVAETRYFSFDNNGPVTNPQETAAVGDNKQVLGWFRALMGLRNDASKGLQGNDNNQVTRTGRRTVAFTCGAGQRLFAVVTFGTPDQRQDSSWLGLPGGSTYKEILNSSWPDYQAEGEIQFTNGGYDAQIYSGQILNLPYIGTVVLERR
ncbi:MAG TPA: alpha-amylase family glycosyl hydrolase, partial [Bacteroidota bacterium]|nr:alpha-amylase family glycosyl hydrolase [Bacteroidota bacterium]